MLPELEEIPGHRPSDLLYFQFNVCVCVCAFGASKKDAKTRLAVQETFWGTRRQSPREKWVSLLHRRPGRREAGQAKSWPAVQFKAGGGIPGPSRRLREVPNLAGTGWHLRQTQAPAGCSPGEHRFCDCAGFPIRSEAAGASHQLHSQKQETREAHFTAATPCQVTAAGLPAKTCL